MKSDGGYSMEEGVTVGVFCFLFTIGRERKNERNGWIVAAIPGVLSVMITLRFLKNRSKCPLVMRGVWDVPH